MYKKTTFTRALVPPNVAFWRRALPMFGSVQRLGRTDEQSGIFLLYESNFARMTLTSPVTHTGESGTTTRVH